MSVRTSRLRRATLAVLAAPMALGAVAIGPAQTAQASHGSVGNSYEWRDTSDCPCYLGDEYDGTYFRHDSGGYAAKDRIYSHGDLVGKMEFHPYGEKFWIYDTKANNDAIWYKIDWKGGDWVGKVPSGRHSLMVDVDIPEGRDVTIEAYDDIADTGVPYNRLGDSYGTS